AIEENGKIIPKIKLSENVGKITNPGFKQVWRLFDRKNGKAIADLLTLRDERIDGTQSYQLFDPVHTWKRKNIHNFQARLLLKPIFVHGNCVYESPTLPAIRDYCQEQVGALWEEVLRFENPHQYYVDLSQPLWEMKESLLAQCATK
ncbi:MAG TPA: nicotinate phosphoribosyltransferase, partial [Bacillota bacterium]|nr:nicotinate phosphoribosyltransferase [Bacillota bacterium]